MKKKIGICDTEASFENYCTWFTAEDLGNEFELVTLASATSGLPEIESCSGYVLTGGVDVSPSYYGVDPNYPNAPSEFRQERDAFESSVYEFAKFAKRPILGICRGMQLVNVLEQGKLVADLGPEGNTIHKKEEKDKQHSIKIVEGSLLHSISGEIKGNVNSAHHQAVDANTISDKLQANAWTSGEPEIIEGLEFKNKSNKGFMLCVQWHPERMEGKELNPLSQKIKEQFLAAVKKV